MEHLSTRGLPRLSWIDTLYSSTYTFSSVSLDQSIVFLSSALFSFDRDERNRVVSWAFDTVRAQGLGKDEE